MVHTGQLPLCALCPARLVYDAEDGDRRADRQGAAQSPSASARPRVRALFVLVRQGAPVAGPVPVIIIYTCRDARLEASAGDVTGGKWDVSPYIKGRPLRDVGGQVWESQTSTFEAYGSAFA